MTRPHIVILGAGYGGLCVAHRLQQLTTPEQAMITIVDRNSYHVNMINLHEVALGNAQGQDISFDLVHVVRKPHARILKAEVTKIDRENKIIYTSREELKYDILVIALGFVSETFGIEGMCENAFQIYSIDESEDIALYIEDQFRNYAFADPSEKDPADISILIGGAGFTGIELLGEIVDRVPLLCKKYGISRECVNIHCVSGDKRMLPMFNDTETAYIKNYLENNGVSFHLGAQVKKATKNSFVYTAEDGEVKEIFGKTLIWAGGVSGSPLMDECFGDQAKRGRLIVNSDLTAPGYDDLYVIGDCAAFISEGSDRPEPTTAQIATQMGYHTAENIVQQLNNLPRKPFKYIYRGTVCSLGAKNGVAHLGNKTITGFFSIRLKRLIESITDYKISGMYNAIKNTRVFKLKNF